MRIAIIADDLTGALDVCAPLASRGMICDVATTPHGVETAIAAGGEVIAINTATRELPVHEALEMVGRVASRLAAQQPEIVLKKVDSRLKGHVRDETRVCRDVFARSRIVIAPGVPSQERHVVGARITGRGVDGNIDVKQAFGDLPALVMDSASISDLEAAARQPFATTLLVGASGLGEGLARVLAGSNEAPFHRVPLPLLAAIGSLDPITRGQLDRLLPLANAVVSSRPNGTLPGKPPVGDLVVCRAEVADGKDFASSMACFGASVAGLVASGRYASALVAGGETAQTVLRALQVACVRVLGAAAPGVPVVRTEVGTKRVEILTKSGGFGTADELVNLWRTAEMNAAGAEMTGEQA